MRTTVIPVLGLSLGLVGAVFAEPRVLVLPFDPIMDSLYGYLSGKESILDYQNALQQMLNAELAKHQEIRVVEIADLSNYLKSKSLSEDNWNNPSAASRIASDLGADYTVIGTYGEFSQEIRLDGRVVVAATAEVPPGHTLTSTVKAWEDIPTAVTALAVQVVPIVTAAGRLRPTSKGILFPEGDLAAYDPTGRAASDQARLVVWVNAPAPDILSEPRAFFHRCQRIDRMNVPEQKQKSHSCHVALLPPGRIRIHVLNRGFLPYEQSFELATGKVYRLEVELIPVERVPR